MNKKIRKEIIEWVILISVIIILFTTPIGKTISSTLQRGLLATGIFQPSIEKESKKADLNISLITPDGMRVDVKTFEGKTIFINFWATWCAPCIAEMPDIQALYEEMIDEEEIVFLLISMDKDFEKASSFFQKKNYSLPLYSLTRNLPDVYSTSSIPTTYVIGRDGEIKVEQHGMAKYNTEKFRNLLRGY